MTPTEKQTLIRENTGAVRRITVTTARVVAP